MLKYEDILINLLNRIRILNADLFLTANGGINFNCFYEDSVQIKHLEETRKLGVILNKRLDFPFSADVGLDLKLVNRNIIRCDR